MNDQAKIALVAFNLTLIVLMISLWMMSPTVVAFSVFLQRLGISAVISAVVGGIAFFVAKMFDK